MVVSWSIDQTAQDLIRMMLKFMIETARKSFPVWACFTADGTCPFIKIEGMFVKEKYLEIL